MNMRSIATIAREIRADWEKSKSGIYFGAKPYLGAMLSLDRISDSYGEDSGRMVVAYFLSNATGYRGETARRCKAELKAMLSGGK